MQLYKNHAKYSGIRFIYDVMPLYMQVIMVAPAKIDKKTW